MKDTLQKLTKIIDTNADLNTQKENISNYMKEVEFLLGGEDEQTLESFAVILNAMSVFDFTQRVNLNKETASEVAIGLAAGVNMLCEEYQESAIQINVMKTLLASLTVQEDLIILSNGKGIITFVNKLGNRISTWNDKALLGCGINTIFENFENIDVILKEGSSRKDIPVILKWKGQSFHAKLNLSICSNRGTLESMIYVIRL